MDDQPQSVAPAPLPVVPPSVQTPSVPKARGIAALIVVVALFGVLAYLAAVFLTGNWWPLEGILSTPTPAPTATPTPAAEAPWKTYGSVATGFSLRVPPDMTVTEESSRNPMDGTLTTRLTLSGQALDGNIIVNNPGSGFYAPAEPATTGTVSASGTVITYRTGLYDHSMDGKPAGPERVWVAQFNAGGDSYIVGFVAADGADLTVLVNTIIATFTLPVGR